MKQVIAYFYYVAMVLSLVPAPAVRVVSRRRP